MTKYKRKDVVLVDFGFSEGAGSKKRPVLMVSSDSYNHSRQEVVVLAITSNTKRMLFGDTRIEKWKEAGLLYPSLATGIIRTIKHNLILQKLGVLLEEDFQRVKDNIQKIIE